MENEYTSEQLFEAVSEFLESCHRTGNHNKEDNIKYFLSENDHMDLDEKEVMEVFDEIEPDLKVN